MILIELGGILIEVAIGLVLLLVFNSSILIRICLIVLIIILGGNKQDYDCQSVPAYSGSSHRNLHDPNLYHDIYL